MAAKQHTLIAISTGGGMMEVIAIDGVSLRMDGGYHETLVWLPRGIEPRFDADETIRHELTDSVLWQIKAARFVSIDGLNPLAIKRLAPVLPVPSRKDISLPFTSASEMLAHDEMRHTPLWQLAVDTNESAAISPQTRCWRR